MRNLTNVELNQVVGGLNARGFTNVTPNSSKDQFAKYFNSCLTNGVNPFVNPDSKGSNQYLYDAFDIYVKSLPIAS